METKFNKIHPGIKYPEILHEVRFYESLGFLLLSPLVEILVGSAIYLSFLWGPIGLSVLAIPPFWLVSI